MYRNIFVKNLLFIYKLFGEMLKGSSCHQCDELKSEMLSKEISFQTKLDEKENTIKYLEISIPEGRIQSLLFERERKFHQKLCRKDILDSKVTSNALTMVPETQEDIFLLKKSAKRTENPIVYETLDLGESVFSHISETQNGNGLLKNPAVKTENNFVYETLDLKGSLKCDPYVPETQAGEERFHRIDEKNDMFPSPNNKRKKEETAATVGKESLNASSQSKRFRESNLKNLDEDSVIPKSADQSPSVMSPFSFNKISQMGNSKQSGNSVDSSPSLLNNPISGKTVIHKQDSEITKSNDEVEVSSSCEFLSSVKNQLRLSGEVTKSPIKSGFGKNISFSPSKRKSRQGQMKQTKLDMKKQLKLDKIYRRENVHLDDRKVYEPSTACNVTESEMLLDKIGETSRDSDMDATFFEAPTTLKDFPKDFPDKKEVDIKFKEVVRKKEDRKKLDGHNCHECQKYYGDLNLPEEELKKRMKYCSRHRAKYSPEKSPEHFWEVDLPDTQECIDRGKNNLDF
ncbi:DNA endonuclease RBBP8 [Nymphon striatum]|nr:DNA endonuclease RBBP8 [Nymphon striatum]